MKGLFPILSWLPSYKRSNLGGDIGAGLTVGVMLIPQGMAYAMIAGLPPVYGLYAAMIPQLVYAIFGTSRQLAVGPVAMDSLLVAAGVSAIAVANTEEYIALAILLSFMMGLIQVVFGALRLGFLVNFLSKPVISGFTSAAALIIGLNQLKHILGIEIRGPANVFQIVLQSFEKIPFVNPITLGIAMLGFLLVLYSKKLHKAIPGALVAVVVGILSVIVWDLTERGVVVVGDVPSGLPGFSLPALGSEHLFELIPVAFSLALIAFMESISVAKAIQARHKNEYSLDNNQEMIGLGMGNLLGSFFSAYPTTGGFSRSAVNDQAGAKTHLASIISATLVGVTLLFLTDLFYYLPNAILGSIIIVAVFGLIDLKYPRFLWRTSKQDFIMLVIAFGVTLAVGIKEGIAAGVILSLVMLVYRTTKPHIAILGKLPNSIDYRNIDRFKEIEIREDILIVRQDAQLYFANSSNFIETIRKEAMKKRDLKLIVLHCGSISNIDATALQELEELINEMDESGIKVVFSGLIGPVRDFLYRTGFMTKMGESRFFVRVQSAVDHFDKKSNGNGEFGKAGQSNS